MKSELGMLKSSLHGHANKLMMVTPPSFNRKPWNNIVVEDTDTMKAGGTKIELSQIISALRDQLELPSEVTNLAIKIKRIDVWQLPMSASGSTVKSVRAKFYSIHAMHGLAGSSPGVQIPLALLENTGAYGAQAPVVSYSWPRDQQDIPLVPLVSGSTTTELQVLNVEGIVDEPFIMRYHLFWNTGVEYKSTS